MGRIHRYGQEKDCLIFNFVATNTIEGHVLERLLEKLKEIRDALDDDAVFNVVGEVLPAARVERVLRDYYAGRLGNEDLEDRLLRDVDESRFRNICQKRPGGIGIEESEPGDAGRAARPRQGTPRRAGDHRTLPAGRRATGSVETQVDRRVGAHVRAGTNTFLPAPLRARGGLAVAGTGGALSALQHRPATRRRSTRSNG